MDINPPVLINLGPLKKGGGQNVALNFIQALQRKKDIPFDLFFVVCRDSLLIDALQDSQWSQKLCVVSSNPIKRIIEELTTVKTFIHNNKISLVYTYFGFGLFGNGVKQVIGSADSNLYFPEIDFWHAETPIEKIKRFLVDRYRIYGLKKAAGVIFENAAMFERADALFNIKSKCLILPSIDEVSEDIKLSTDLSSEATKVLMLCGWQRNKNILLIPELSSKLTSLGANIEFIITVDKDDSSCSKEFFALLDHWEAHEQVKCIGSVAKNQLRDLYESVDQVLLLSLLESFSNNIIEAWYFKRPLIIADELWAKAICKDAAYYVQRNDIGAIAKAIMTVVKCEETATYLSKSGEALLSEFPDIDKRTEQELAYLESFYD